MLLQAGLPIEQPTKFELVISRKVATALGVTIPQSRCSLPAGVARTRRRLAFRIK